jgi:hypothetical protein
MKGLPLFHRIKRALSAFALVTLLVAQMAATFHAASHFRQRGDSAGLPGGSHVQFCLECASFTPLASPHGGAITALTVASLGVEMFVRGGDDRGVSVRATPSFQARAPPR